MFGEGEGVALSDEQLAAATGNGAGAPEREPGWWHQQAKERRARGETCKAIGEDLGVSENTVSKVTRRDRPPRARTKKQAGKRTGAPPASQKAQTLAIERALALALTFPAVPAVMFAPDDQSKAFMLQHFQNIGPRTAHQLAEASESWPELRELLEGLSKGSVKATVAFAVLGYAGPPIAWILGQRGVAIVTSGAGQVAPGTPRRAAARQQAQPDPFEQEIRDRSPGGAYYEPPDAEPPEQPSAPSPAPEPGAPPAD